MDITYIPMARGFVYLAAVVDWFSRRVLAHRVSITMDTASASRRSKKLSAAMANRRSSTPTRATSSPAKPSPWAGSKRNIAISMDGKGRWRDNVFVERLWRFDQIRGGLSARLRQVGGRGASQDRLLLRVLQQPTPAFEPTFPPPPPKKKKKKKSSAAPRIAGSRTIACAGWASPTA